MNEMNERAWHRLLTAISEKNVVPIIGKELFRVNDKGINEYLCEEICSKYFIQYSKEITTDFIVEELNKDGDGKRDLCRELKRICNQARVEIPPALTRLLSIGKFPLILTTSYTPFLEAHLLTSGIWDVAAYDKRGKLSENADIPKKTENILYYLFGRIGACDTFVATEEDLLSFLHFWHNEETRPKNLCNYLNGKTLLVLGCEYPDWLFRFMWYSMNNDFVHSPAKGHLLVSNGRVVMDGELQLFLDRIKASYSDDIEGFIDELCKKWDSFRQENRIEEEISEVHKLQSEDIDIFLSYAHEDIEFAEQIASDLTSLGAKVWFDKRQLGGGDDFPSDIKNAILKCRRFMPILSKTVLIKGSRFYRKEWSEALEEAKGRLGQAYITPIMVENINMNENLIPSQFKDNVHVLRYDDNNIREQFQNIIRAIRREQ